MVTTPPGDMINHVAATVYEPGSVFKVFTLAMGIDSKALGLHRHMVPAMVLQPVAASKA